jgi:hypothetical protein
MKALSGLQLMEQNVMVATVDGDIFYVRTGRVPKRAPGFDYKKPLAGNTSKTEWLGIHPFEDLIQFHNPPQGYMQNCNVSPQFLAKGIALDPARYKDRPYLFNGFLNLKESNDNPLHQRAAMCVELLDAEKNMSIEKAMAVAMSPDVYGADVWQKMLKTAWDKADGDLKRSDPAELANSFSAGTAVVGRLHRGGCLPVLKEQITPWTMWSNLRRPDFAEARQRHTDFGRFAQRRRQTQDRFRPA